MNGGGAAIGWVGAAAGLAGIVVYFVVALRRPDIQRLLNGSGLLLTSFALLPARSLVLATRGSAAFPADATIGLLVLAVAAQATAALRHRRAWDGVDRRGGRVLAEQRA